MWLQHLTTQREHCMCACRLVGTSPEMKVELNCFDLYSSELLK